MKDSIAMAENALLEKDQALVRERQKDEECERLQMAINKLVDEAGARTRDEVELVRQQANQSITKARSHSDWLSRGERHLRFICRYWRS